MINTTISNADSRHRQNGTYNSSASGKKPPNAQQVNATKFVALYQRIRKTGQKPSQEEYNELGPLKNDLADLIECYDTGDMDSLDVAFQTLCETRPNILQANATFTETSEQEEKSDPRFTTSRNGKKVLHLNSIEDIYACPDADYLINKIIECATTSLLYGMSGTGKTFTALHLALCVAHGIPWCRRRVKQGVVWYINTEGGRGLKKRLKAWYKEHLYLRPSSNFKIIPWSLDLRTDYQTLIDTLEDQEEAPILIIIDNFSMCTPGVNQNLQEEVAPILRAINGIAQEHGSHVMMIHHTNKVGDANGTMAFRNHVDTMIELKKEDLADKSSPIIFSCQKARDDEPFSDIRTELKQVELYTDPDSLEPVTSCVVIESETPVKQQSLNDVQQDTLNILGDDTMSSSDWQKAVIKDIHISERTFDRTKNALVAKGFVKKIPVAGKRYEHYAKVSPTTDTITDTTTHTNDAMTPITESEEAHA